jgi:rhamnulokinase
MPSPLYIAVDLGAGSGRVFLAGVDPGEFLLEEIHRFGYPPTEEAGHLRWNFSHIFGQIKLGLRKAGERANAIERGITSIGVDSWGVDYGLLDANGHLIANPVCYRDQRTKDAMQQVFAVVPRWEIFEKTSIQFQSFNTLFQLWSEGENLRNASKLLLLPDLINYFLTGKPVAEYTNATTTQMVNAATRDWDVDLLKRLDIPIRLLPVMVPSGTEIGELTPEIADELGLDSVRVVAPATHDTGSAVAGAPLVSDWAYISSGTWSLIGIEREEPLISADIGHHNFTNEGGAFGTIRFLKNVMGLWILESCRKEWTEMGIEAGYDSILRQVSDAKGYQAFIFPDDERFLNPPSMIDAIREQLVETGQEYDGRPEAISKVIFDSLAFRYASVLGTIESLTGKEVRGVQIVGGGGRNRYLNQMTANASGLTIQAGPTEAAVVGNVLVQAVSSGRFVSLADARQYVRESFSFEEFVPRSGSDLNEASKRYAAIEARFVKLNQNDPR